MRLLLVRPSQNTGGDNTLKAPQTLLAHLTLRNQTSLIPMTFELEEDDILKPSSSSFQWILSFCGRVCHRLSMEDLLLEGKGSIFFYFFSSEMGVFRRKA